MNTQLLTLDERALVQRNFMAKVYGWMAWALLMTGAIAFFVASQPSLVYSLVNNRLLFWGLLLGEFGLVWYLSSAIDRISAQAASFGFIIYSILNGVTLSVIFFLYTSESIASTFFITAGTFSAMSVYGSITKRDLTSFGNFLMMGLIGIIIASFANFFFHSEMIYWVTTYIGVFIFIGLTAYDTQKIKNIGLSVNSEGTYMQKAALMGALCLYLDFINLFLLLLRIFGRRK